MRALSAQLIGRRPGLVAAVGWVAAFLAALMLSAAVASRANRPVTDFHSYFTAGHLVAEGKPIANFYDSQWFSVEANRFAPNFYEIYNANMPTTALAYAPLAFFESHTGARLVWTILSVPLLILFVEALARMAGAGAAERPYWYAAVFLAQPVAANMIQGQAYIVVGLGLVLVCQWWRDRREARAGAVLGALFAYKSAGLLLWPLAIASGRWRLVLAGCATLAAIVAATWPLIGWDGWSAYLNALRELSVSSPVRATAFQSVQGFMQHLFSGGESGGAPVLALSPTVARTLALSTVVLLLLLTVYAASRNRDADLVVGAGILLTLVAVPVTLVHAYTIAFIPIAQLIRNLRFDKIDWRALALWMGAAMIMVPSPFRSPRLFDGWAAVMAYPKLYGALLLWALCAALLLRRESSASIAGIEPAVP